MTYLSNNSVQASDYNDLAGQTGVGAGSSTNASSKAGFLYGVGFGDRGYGQAAPSLSNVSAGQTVGQEWQNLRTVVQNLANWQGLNQALIPASSNFTAGSLIRAHESNRAATTYRVVSLGYQVMLSSAYGVSPGMYNGATQVAGAARSFVLVRVSRSTGAITFVRGYDVYGNAAEATNLANDLNASDSSSFVVLYTYDEPQANRLTGGLPAAVYRCGGSTAIFGSDRFRGRGAYVLVGIPGCGEGLGYEAYAGTFDSVTDAIIDVNVVFQNGTFRVTDNANFHTRSILYDGQPAQPDIAPLGSYSMVDFADVINIIDANRLKYQPTNMTLSTLASSTRGPVWGAGAGSITCEFQVTFSSEDHARYFFNTGGELRIALSHPVTTTARDASWNTVLSGLVCAFRANASSRMGGNTGYGSGIGYYQLTTSFQTILDGTNSGTGVYTSNDYYIQARAVSIGGTNGAKGSVIQFRVVLADEQSNGFQDLVQGGTSATLQQLRATSGFPVVTPTAVTTVNF